MAIVNLFIGEDFVNWLDNFPTRSIDAIGDILEYGASKGYKPGGWRKEGFDYHMGKVIGHLRKYIDGSTEEDHLECALCRLAMAVDIRREERNGR